MGCGGVAQHLFAAHNPPKAAPKQRRLAHEQRVFYYALLAGLPALIVAGTLLLTGDFTPKVLWTLSLVMILFWLGFALALREHVVRPLQTMANLLTALREGDFSTRARSEYFFAGLRRSLMR